jgi:transcriptional regulator with XRE-family HTH domain
MTQIDPAWWTSSTYEGRPMREILRRRDIAAVFGFLASRGWSRAAIAAATGLSESRVRGIRQGRQQITSYEVLERIADGLGIQRGLIGLAYTDYPIDSRSTPSADGKRSGPTGAVLTVPIGEPGSPIPGDADDMRTHLIDGKLMALVGEGVVLFGPHNEMIWLPAFYIDVTPVTNAEYAAFVAATAYRTPSHWSAGAPPDALHDHPVVNVTHHDASAYAAWAAKALPTVEQWEKAARGDKGNVYPWGDQPTPAKCNVRETGVGHTTPVGIYRSGISPYGVSDLSGNVWEWCATETAPGRYALRGSAFTSPFSAAAAAATNDACVDMLDDDTGFRCVLPL